ncbi:uncharacterized protein BROUX77_005202 [Berkeleyomyces rouxiae]|uniref:uncharacterized protein n=1 Tax=Berkeleyomyces rouxiae TaxID=2035830 RepID=UPI003B7A3E96
MVHIPGAFDRDNDYGLENRDHEFSTEIDYRSSFDADKTAANREFSLINSSSIINATSANSVSGPSSPPPDQPRPTEFSPPTRPSSTPYLQVAASDHLPLAEPDMEEVVSFSGPNREFLLDPGLEEAKPIETCGFSRLPVEIHEEILNYIFGSQYGAQSCPSVIAPRNVSTRRFTPRDISDLALVGVKNVCRFYETTPEGPSSGTGIQDALFIQYFESLVLSAVQCLGNAVSVNYLRIRYVDLDSIVPPLNPYFLIQNNECTGVWSNAIISELQKHRPKISFPDLDASCSAVRVNEDGIMVLNPDFKKTKIKSFKLSNYAFVQQALGPL